MSNILVYTTPKESNVYSKSVCTASDPYRVEPIESIFFYKHPTLSGSNKTARIQNNLKGLRYE